MVADEELNKEIEYGKNMTVEALKDSMEVSLAAYGAKTDWFLALEKLLFPSDR